MSRDRKAGLNTCVTRPDPESQDHVANHLYLKLTLELITLFRVLVSLPPSRFEIFRANSGLNLAVRTPDTLLHADVLKTTG